LSAAAAFHLTFAVAGDEGLDPVAGRAAHSSRALARRRNGISQAWGAVCRGGASVLRRAGQDRQLPGRRLDRFARRSARVANHDGAVCPRRLGRGRGPTRPRRHSPYAALSPQVADRLDACAAGAGGGPADRRRPRRCGLWQRARLSDGRRSHGSAVRRRRGLALDGAGHRGATPVPDRDQTPAAPRVAPGRVGAGHEGPVGRPVCRAARASHRGWPRVLAPRRAAAHHPRRAQSLFAEPASVRVAPRARSPRTRPLADRTALSGAERRTRPRSFRGTQLPRVEPSRGDCGAGVYVPPVGAPSGDDTVADISRGAELDSRHHRGALLTRAAGVVETPHVFLEQTTTSNLTKYY